MNGPFRALHTLPSRHAGVSRQRGAVEAQSLRSLFLARIIGFLFCLPRCFLGVRLLRRIVGGMLPIEKRLGPQSAECLCGDSTPANSTPGGARSCVGMHVDETLFHSSEGRGLTLTSASPACVRMHTPQHQEVCGKRISTISPKLNLGQVKNGIAYRQFE